MQFLTMMALSIFKENFSILINSFDDERSKYTTRVFYVYFFFFSFWFDFVFYGKGGCCSNLSLRIDVDVKERRLGEAWQLLLIQKIWRRKKTSSSADYFSENKRDKYKKKKWHTGAHHHIVVHVDLKLWPLQAQHRELKKHTESFWFCDSLIKDFILFFSFFFLSNHK